MPDPTLLVLGRAELLDADAAPLALPSKAIALLTYLRLTATHRAHRAFLADLLWSEVDEEKGRASLRQAVLTIRHLLGDKFVTAVGQDIQLVGSLDCDAASFVSLAATGAYLDAAQLYRGDFFSQFAVPGAHGFELWATIERDRLRGIFLRAADTAAQQLLDAGRAKAAVDVASRLIEVDETRERSWRLRLEARLTLGDLAGARVDAETMRAVLTANEVTLEPATTALLTRIQRSKAPASEATSGMLRADLIGRTRAFSCLLDAWKALGTSGLAVRLLTGEAGLGKTRLQDDLEVRLRSLGGRVVRVNARYGDHEIPYALLQHLAESLVKLPGAAGIAPESARTLVTLEPRLAAVFEHQEPESTVPVDLPLRRSTALADLMAAVCDDRSVALLIDDLHWADEASVRTIVAAVSRNRSTRMLLVVSERPSLPSGVAGDEVALHALTAADVRELIISIQPLPDAPWADVLADRLAAGSGGIPLLVLEALQLLIQEALISRGSTTWEAADPQALITRLESLDVLRERLARLDDAMRSALLRTAIAGGAIQESLIAGDTNSPIAAGAMRRLSLGGWIIRADGRVTVRHDEIARTIMETATPAMLEQQRQALVMALRNSAIKTQIEWRIAARMAYESSDLAAVSATMDQWIAADPGVRRRLGWRGATHTLLGQRATTAYVGRLAAARPWRERLGASTTRISAAAVMVVAVGASAWVVRHRAVTPFALRFVNTPISGRNIGMTPEIVVEVLNQDGRRVSGNRDTIELTMRSSSARLDGEIRAVAIDGLAVFPHVRLSGDADRGAFLSARRGRLRTPEVRLLGSGDATLRIAGIRLPDASISSLRGDTVVVLPGRRVKAELSVRYTSPWIAASVMFAGIPTWGDRTTNAIELGSFATPMISGTRFTALSFTAPVTLGRYRVFLVMAAESDAAHIASGTNWLVGAPIWGDGNDIADWTSEQANEARRSGHLRLGRNAWVYRNERGPADLGVAVLEVLVTTQLSDTADARIALSRAAK